jgi:HEAT repeat protein
MPEVGKRQTRLLVPIWFAAFAIGGGVLGCAEGPLARYGEWNPWVKARWEQEDADYGPSFQTRVARLRSVRNRVAKLAPAEGERISQELVESLRNETNPALRREVVLTLGTLRTETADTGLREALSAGDSELRIAACSAWRMRGGPEALERLSELVGSDTDPDVRLAATRALAGFRDPTAIRALGVALDDPNPALQFQAVESLRSVTGKDFGGNIAAWRDYARGEAPSAAPAPSFAERLFKWQ